MLYQQSESDWIWKSIQIPKFRQIAEKYVKLESDSDTNDSQSSWNNFQEPGKETGWTGNLWKNWTQPDDSTTKIG